MLVNLESHGTRSVEIKGHFAFVHFTGNQFPAFFWKLHVSLPPRDYERHIQSIVDFLVMRKVDFKFVNTEDDLFLMLGNSIPVGQIGKLVTIYPTSIDEARAIATMLASMLQDCAGPEIKTDRHFNDSRAVSYRFGSFFGENTVLTDQKTGKEFADDRRPAFHLPEWIHDPFHTAIPATGTSLQQRYSLRGIIKRANQGNIYRGVDAAGREVIIKEGRKFFPSSPENKLESRKREFSISTEIRSKGFSYGPQPLETIDEDFSTFFIYLFRPAESLHDFPAVHGPLTVTDSEPSFHTIERIMHTLILRIKELHDAGYADIDITDANVSFDGDNVFFLDFDSLHTDDTHQFPKTPCYWIDDFRNDSPQNRDYRCAGMLMLYLIGDYNYYISSTGDIRQGLRMAMINLLRLKINPRRMAVAAHLLLSKRPGKWVNETNRIDASRIDISQPISSLLQRIITTHDVKLFGTNTRLELHPSSHDDTIYRSWLRNSDEDWKKASTGICGLAGCLLYCGDDCSLLARNVKDVVFRELRIRHTVFRGQPALFRDGISNVISPYIDDGIAGIILAACLLRDSSLREIVRNYVSGISGLSCKGSHVWNGMAGWSLALLACKNAGYDVPSNTIQQQLESCIQYLTFKGEALIPYGWNDTAEHPVYGDDVNSLFDVIELFISTERRKNRD